MSRLFFVVEVVISSPMNHGGRDTGHDFFVSQILGNYVTFPGTCIVG